jgi:transglutaminase-like putative cysteine protease
VCQDHAHVFIASARAVGMPARYVSGYLYTGDAKDAASHAWVDVWLGAEIGWQSVDVTHKRPAVRTYCRLAVGRDYLDAAPVRGMRQGGGGEKMEANVLVADSAQQQ